MWQSSSGTTENRNDWQDAFERVWRAPFKAIEDRNGWLVAALGGTATWRSSSGAAKDRNSLAAVEKQLKANVAVVLRGNRGSQPGR